MSKASHNTYPAYTDTDYFALLTTALKKCMRFCSKKDILL